MRADWFCLLACLHFVVCVPSIDLYPLAPAQRKKNNTSTNQIRLSDAMDNFRFVQFFFILAQSVLGRFIELLAIQFILLFRNLIVSHNLQKLQQVHFILGQSNLLAMNMNEAIQPTMKAKDVRTLKSHREKWRENGKMQTDHIGYCWTWIALQFEERKKQETVKTSGRIVKLFGNEWIEVYTICACAPKNKNNNKTYWLLAFHFFFSVYWITWCFVHIVCSHNLTNGRKEHVTQIRANEWNRLTAANNNKAEHFILANDWAWLKHFRSQSIYGTRVAIMVRLITPVRSIINRFMAMQR